MITTTYPVQSHKWGLGEESVYAYSESNGLIQGSPMQNSIIKFLEAHIRVGSDVIAKYKKWTIMLY